MGIPLVAWFLDLTISLYSEEVQEFDKAIKRRQQGPRSPPETEESMDQDDSDADMPARKKVNGCHYV